MSQNHWISICSQREGENYKGEGADSYNLVILGIKKNHLLFICFIVCLVLFFLISSKQRTL